MVNFDYYYGEQADQFSFIKIPKLMLTNEMFSNLSIQAKVLYGVLLDRMSLSMKNKWLDENNRVFIIYQIGEIQEDLGFTKKRAMGLLAELEEFGLLEKKRRGHGLPNILYIKSFLTDDSSRGVEDGTSGQNMVQSRGADIGTTRGDENDTQEVAVSGPQEVPKMAPLKNNTKTNNTYESNTESNQILSERCDEMGSDAQPDIAKAYELLIKENIGYEDLLVIRPLDRELIDGIVDLILETVLSQREKIVIASNSYPAALVKSKLLKLNYSHIEYVMYCLDKNTTKVNNIKKYLLAALFNAPSTIDGYYRAEVNHDMYGTELVV